jgi:iron complex transport system substrate-binding protein
VGVTHECDYPPGIEHLPKLTRTRIPSLASSSEIDAAVSEQRGSLYELDRELLAELKPDLILTQSQCDVCAVNEGVVRGCAAALPEHPQVESVNPTDWAGVVAMFARIGELLAKSEERRRLSTAIESDATLISKRCAGRDRPSAVFLEWLDPPFVAGHWIPELVAMAGGRELLGRSGEVSRRGGWEEIAEVDPEILLLSPCGFSLSQSEKELPNLLGNDQYRKLTAVRTGRVVLIDGNQFFSRPGPRLRESLRIAAAVFHPEVCLDLAPTQGWRMLAGSQ